MLYHHTMLIPFCLAKIHGVTVTEANLGYKGSITVDQDLIDAVGMKEFKPGVYVNVTSKATGAFWRTYLMSGKRGSGVVCLNGPPARHFQAGDTAFIMFEAHLTPEEVEHAQTKVVLVDEKNKVTQIKIDSAEDHHKEA